MAHTVHFYHQRHGEHQDDNLTRQGLLQVAAGAERHLRGINFHNVFASEMNRARQTAQQALRTIGKQAPIGQDPNWGFAYAEECPLIKKHPWKKALKKVAERRAARAFTPVDFVHEHWPIGHIVRHVLRCMMKLTTENLARSYESGCELNVLVGGHASNAHAALDPAKMEGCPNFGDIIHYTWSIGQSGQAELIRSVHLPSGVTEF